MMENKTGKYLILPYIFFFLYTTVSGQVSYHWPCQPFDQQHFINGTFCENRNNGSINIDHFHDGVDINLAQGNNVYSVIDGNVTGIGSAADYGINSYVRVGRYAYVHINASPGIQVGSVVKAFETVIGTTNSYNHIHFKDGNPGLEINPLRKSGGLDPFDDPYPPTIESVNLYINGTTTRFADRRVNGLVEIVAKAQDKTDNGPLGSNNGIYGIGYQIYDSTGTIALGDSIQNITFYQIPPSDAYITNVYFQGSDLSNYFYTVTNRITADGYWDTRDLPFGKYKIQVFTTDSYFNRDEFWVNTEIVEQDATPPDTPVPTAFEGDNNHNWRLSWLSNSQTDIAGYKLFFSFTGDVWFYQSAISGTIAPADTFIAGDNLENDLTMFFRLLAYDGAALPNYSDSSTVYGVRLSADGPQALIVNGFSRTDGYWQHATHRFVINYGLALSALGVAFNSCSVDALVRGEISLPDYPTVIYFTGDDSGASEALGSSAQDLLSTYLRQGGTLILNGSEIGSALFLNGSSGDSLFYTGYLRSECVSDSGGSLTVTGASSAYLQDFGGSIDPGVRPDVLAPTGSYPILQYGDGSTAGIYYKGIFPGGSTEGQLVYLAFPVEQLQDAADQNRLIEDLLNLTGVVNGVAIAAQKPFPEGTELRANYPNPFNPATTLVYYLRYRRQAGEDAVPR